MQCKNGYWNGRQAAIPNYVYTKCSTKTGLPSALFCLVMACLQCVSFTPFEAPTCNPPPFRREKPNVPAQRSGEPFFQQKRFPVPRISVPGRKHTFLLVVRYLE